jgi:acetolactate synthase-1/2/3 large subunit
MDNKKIRVSKQIADWLVKHGIEQVFSVTGGGSMFLNYDLGSHPKLKCTFMHHEQACAMAAEGYARITGKPALVMVTTGPGPINAMNGVYGAFTDSIPMIVISGQIKRDTCVSFYDLPNLRQLGDQEGPTIAMVSPICKYAKLVRESSDLKTMLPEAYAQAIGGRPGPVWLDIPLDIQNSIEELNIPSYCPIADPQETDLRKECQILIEKLKSSKRPLILGGTGVRLAGAKDRLLALIERLGIPLSTAWTHDLIRSNHPLFAGRPGAIGTRAGNFCLQGSDFVLVLGSRLNIRQTGYNWNAFAQDAWLAQVDVDPAELGKPTIRPDQPIVADINQFLDCFETMILETKLPSYNKWAVWCRDIGNKYAAINDHSQIPGAPLNPYIVVDRIFQQLRDNDIIACGNASACILPFQVGNLKSEQRLFSNSGSASMGYDLPAAIGSSVADKGRVICFAGDGSLQMNIQELQTLKTAGTNLIVVVLNNKGYLSIKQTHENFFGKIIGATPESGVDFPDFAAVAEAYGIKSATISNEQDLTTLDDLIQSNGPLLINIMVDPDQSFAPRMKARLDDNGNFIPQYLDDMFPFLDPQEIKSVRESAKTIK